MNYLDFFINDNKTYLLIVSLLFLVPGLIDLYKGEHNPYLSLQIVGGIIGLLAIIEISMEWGSLPKVAIALMATLAFFLMFKLHQRYLFLGIFNSSTAIGFITIFILTAGAVGSPEAAIPSALLGGLAVGFASTSLAHNLPLFFTKLKGAISVSFIAAVLSSSVLVFVLLSSAIACSSIVKHYYSVLPNEQF